MRAFITATLLLTPVLALAGTAFEGEEAREHYTRGVVLYEATRYEAALREFEVAQALEPHADLIYDLARCLDRLDRRAEAVAAYRQYLIKSPDADNVAAVLARVTALEPAAAAVPVTAATTTPATAITTPHTTEPRPKPQTRRPYLVPGLVGGSALAVAAIGAGLLGSAVAEFHSLDSSCAPTCSSSSWSSLPAREHAGDALLGIAGAAAVVDVVLFVVEAKKRSKR